MDRQKSFYCSIFFTLWMSQNEPEEKIVPRHNTIKLFVPRNHPELSQQILIMSKEQNLGPSQLISVLQQKTTEVNERVQNQYKELSEKLSDHFLREQSKILSSIQEQQERFVSELKQLFENEVTLLDTKINQLSSLDDKLNQHVETSNQKLKIVFNNMEYRVSRDVLLKEPSYFSGLLSGSFEDPIDKDGEIFVNRNGEGFQLIIDHLNGNDISFDIQQLTTIQSIKFWDDVDFFCIKSVGRKYKPRKVKAWTELTLLKLLKTKTKPRKPNLMRKKRDYL